MSVMKKMRIAMPAWETGRIKSGLGSKAGGLGSVLEELPEALVQAASASNIKLEIEILTPCFAFYDRSILNKDSQPLEVVLDKKTFDFSTYRRKVDDNISVVYFWDGSSDGPRPWPFIPMIRSLASSFMLQYRRPWPVISKEIPSIQFTAMIITLE
jgi:hypothetical protein